MNIGIFTDTYFPQINGVATSTRILERELNNLGHKVFIFTTTDPNIRHSSPYIFRLPSMPLVFIPTHRMALFYPPKLLWRIRRLKLDVVHTQSEFPLGVLGKLVAELYDLPHIHTYHTMWEDYTHYVANGHLITRGMAKRASRIFCNRASAVIAPVEKTKQSLLEYGVKRPIHVIPTGIELSKFGAEGDTAALKAELGIAPDAPVVLFVGRLAKEKSIDVIINAMPELLSALPGSRLLIIGGGPAEDELKQLAEALGISHAVIFAGPKPWSVISHYYHLGDVFVTASTSETQGLTYAEAMAARVPVAAKKDPSVEGMIIHGQTGYLFENRDDLAGKLRHILTNPYEARAVTDNAHKKISELSSETFGANVSRLYEEVAANHKPDLRSRLATRFRVGRGVEVMTLKRDKEE
ncbi:MAG: glycosyltransferase family 4 protein [Defluviitaleaceae bacterium]|nr:glycosyltransferase family 4 protein [Defluviitaleaceae bacterium]